MTHALAISSLVLATSAGASPLTASASGSRLYSAGAGGGFAKSSSADNGGVQSPEIFNAGDAAGAAGANRVHSAAGSPGVTATSQPTGVTMSTPNLLTSFNALNHFQNRFGADGGKQFSLEPPDQGLCVGSNGSTTVVMETLNDVLRVYSTAGTPLTAPTALNPFFGETHAIIRMANPDNDIFGEFETDPACLYDPGNGGHWFVDDLAIDVVTTGANGGKFTGPNHLNIAVSNTADPTGAWTVYRLAVQDDGTNTLNGAPGPVTTPNHGCSGYTPENQPSWVTNPTACFGDFPHIGSNADGIYITTNEYSFFGPEFHGAQVYSFSKSQLETLAASVNMDQKDTHGMDTFGFALNGFTLWPTTTPGGGGSSEAGDTEYFLSSNAGAEAHDTGDGTSTEHPSTQLLTWALTNTSSLGSSPSLNLFNTEDTVGLYSTPPAAQQKSGPEPLRTCLNNSHCSQLVALGFKDPFAETSGPLDSSDTRMLTAEFVNGKLWGALDTAVAAGNGKGAGIEWFKVTPATTSSAVTATATSGYLTLAGENLIYPAIGITTGGTGVMGFTVVGSNMFPSAGYSLIEASGPGAVHVAAAGVGPQDGFTEYKIFGPVTPGIARPRWGDYGAAVVWGDNVWIANEYIAQSCDFNTWLSTNLRCGNTRTFFANWGTRISEVAAP